MSTRSQTRQLPSTGSLGAAPCIPVPVSLPCPLYPCPVYAGRDHVPAGCSTCTAALLPGGPRSHTRVQGHVCMPSPPWAPPAPHGRNNCQLPGVPRAAGSGLHPGHTPLLPAPRSGTMPGAVVPSWGVALPTPRPQPVPLCLNQAAAVCSETPAASVCSPNTRPHRSRTGSWQRRLPPQPQLAAGAGHRRQPELGCTGGRAVPVFPA